MRLEQVSGNEISKYLSIILIVIDICVYIAPCFFSNAICVNLLVVPAVSDTVTRMIRYSANNVD